MLPEAPDSWTLQEAAHLLSRAGFGGSPRQIKELHGRGRKKAVDWLLAMDAPLDEVPVPEWAADEQAILAKARTRFRESREGMRGLSAEEREKKRRMLNQERQREQRKQSVDLQDWWFRRMVQTEAPLREKMTLFWHDHFPSSVQKVRVTYLLYKQNALFRENAVGNFKDLTRKVTVDPAMMLYLDTQTSKKGKPNENFSRELMELFTLGEGNYTEQDVKEAARAFTGYTVNRLTGVTGHQKGQWDGGEKTVLGKKGRFDGDGVIDVLFEQRACAEYLPKKLWEFFAYESPSEELVEGLGQSFREGGFEVSGLLREILRSKEFYSSQAMRTQIKSPIQFLVQMIRQLELSELPKVYTVSISQQLGQSLFRPPNVAGWDWGRAWINTNALLTRYNVAGFVTKGTNAEAMASGGGGAGGAGGGAMMRMQGMMRTAGRNWAGPDYERIVPRELRKDSAELVKLLSFRFFNTQLDEKHQKTFAEFADAKRGVVFTNTEVAELVHLMMSTPHYQLT
jgi:uncharacterized protein (DUF1800 family)